MNKLTKLQIFGIIMAVIFSPLMLLGAIAFLPIIYIRAGYEMAEVSFEEFEKWLSNKKGK